jgi:hypothetical protein
MTTPLPHLKLPIVLTPKFWRATAGASKRPPIFPKFLQKIAIRTFVKHDRWDPDCIVAVLVQDDEWINENDPEYVDLGQLRNCLSKSGTYFPWTCACGFPGCAGIEKGIAVSHQGGVSTWHNLDGFGSIRFETSMLRKAFDKALSEGARLLANTPNLEVVPAQNLVEYQSPNIPWSD